MGQREEDSLVSMMKHMMSEMSTLKGALEMSQARQEAMEAKLVMIESVKERSGEREMKRESSNGEDEVNRKRLQERDEQATLLLCMGKSCKVEPYKGNRAMGVLEGWDQV